MLPGHVHTPLRGTLKICLKAPGKKVPRTWIEQVTCRIGDRDWLQSIALPTELSRLKEGFLYG